MNRASLMAAAVAVAARVDPILYPLAGEPQLRRSDGWGSGPDRVSFSAFESKAIRPKLRHPTPEKVPGAQTSSRNVL